MTDFKHVVDVFNRVAEAKGKAKDAILKEELPKSEFLQKVAKYALDQSRAFNVTELAEEKTTGEDDPDKIFAYLDFLSDKRGASHAEIADLTSLCKTPESRDVVTRIINKDLRIGAKAKSFNRAIKDLIYFVPYNRYSSFSKVDPDKLEGVELICQLKNDGMFSYMADAEAPLCTRQGNRYSLNGALESEWQSGWLYALQERVKEDIITEGEVLVLGDNGKFLPRKTGNSMINEFLDGIGPDITDRIHYIIWGYVTVKDYEARKSDTIYREIWDNIVNVYNSREWASKISPTLGGYVKDYAAAMEKYREWRLIDLEGAMLKVPDKLKWKDNTSGNPDGFKMKPEAEAEFEIVDAYYGDKRRKWAGHLGGLVVKSADGMILSDVGGGFTDEERLRGVDWWKNQIGKIISVKFTGLITDKTDRETFCLDHSRLAETRFKDKDEADSYEYCVEQLKAA